MNKHTLVCLISISVAGLTAHADNSHFEEPANGRPTVLKTTRATQVPAGVLKTLAKGLVKKMEEVSTGEFPPGSWEGRCVRRNVEFDTPRNVETLSLSDQESGTLEESKNEVGRPLIDAKGAPGLGRGVKSLSFGHSSEMVWDKDKKQLSKISSEYTSHPAQYFDRGFMETGYVRGGPQVKVSLRAFTETRLASFKNSDGKTRLVKLVNSPKFWEDVNTGEKFSEELSQNICVYMPREEAAELAKNEKFETMSLFKDVLPETSQETEQDTPSSLLANNDAAEPSQESQLDPTDNRFTRNSDANAGSVFQSSPVFSSPFNRGIASGSQTLGAFVPQFRPGSSFQRRQPFNPFFAPAPRFFTSRPFFPFFFGRQLRPFFSPLSFALIRPRRFFR